MRFILLHGISLDRDILDGRSMPLPSLCLPITAGTGRIFRDAPVHDLPMIPIIDRKGNEITHQIVNCIL